jgi:hypothetical protein
MTLSLLIGSEASDELTFEEYKVKVGELLDLLGTDLKAVKGRIGTVTKYTGLTEKQRKNLGQAGDRAQIGTDRIKAFKEAIE